jgi:WD40 repeat protein
MRIRRLTVMGLFFALTWLSLDRRSAAQESLPKGALQRIGAARFRTGDGILSLAYSADGKYLASGGRNDVVRLWNAETGQLVRVFRETWVWGLAFSPDGKLLATGGANKIVRLWDQETGKEIHSGKLDGHTATVKSLAFAKDGAVLVSGSDDGAVRVWNIADGRLAQCHEGHTFGVNAVGALPDKQTFLSAGIDRTLRFWTDKPTVFHAPSGLETIACLDDKTVITGGDDGFIRVWDKAGAKEVRSWRAHADSITHMALSRDGKTLVTGGLDNELNVWDVKKAIKLRSIPRRLGDRDSLAMTADGKVLAIGGFNNTILRFDVVTGKPLAGFPSLYGAASALACSADGNLLAAAFTTNQVQLLDFATGKEKHRLICGPEDAELLLALTPDGSLLATVSLPDTIKLWTTATGKEKGRLTLAERDEVRYLAFGPDGKQLAIGYVQGGVRLWDAASAKVVKQIDCPRGAWSLAYAPDGKTLALGMEDAVVLFDTQTWQPAREFGKLNDTVACMAFAPDGRHLAAGMSTGAIRLFDLTQSKNVPGEPRSLDGHHGMVNSIAWSANGRCLVSAGLDRSVRLWEFVNGSGVAKWDGHEGEATAVVLHPFGRKAVSASRDTSLLVWDVTLGAPLDAKGLNAEALDELWDNLASDNNALGNKALWSLAAAPKDSIGYLSKKVFVADPKKIERCIKDLDSKQIKVRNQASATLANYGRWVEGVLMKTLHDRPPEEVRQRIVLLLDRMEGKMSFQQERLRARRIIEVLEQTQSPSAFELLQKLAKGAAEQDLRDMARAALRRGPTAAEK